MNLDLIFVNRKTYNTIVDNLEYLPARLCFVDDNDDQAPIKDGFALIIQGSSSVTVDLRDLQWGGLKFE
ncbi:hypothetical protein HSE3_gp137 [Bacillus phage vB_BceM-HSE3]|nr:hypothetical protein HSE3_gp137 [Bacillus phage vB_BceM-HSE3]